MQGLTWRLLVVNGLTCGLEVGTIYVPALLLQAGMEERYVTMMVVLLGLQVMPQASRLAALVSPQRPRWLEATLQAGAVCLLEFCGQACFTLLVALLSDLVPGEEESRRGGQEAFIYALLTLVFLSCLLTTAFIPEQRGTRGAERKTYPQILLKTWLCRLFSQSERAQQATARCPSVLQRLYGAYEDVPTVIRRLFVAELCSWSLMSSMLFYTDFMGQGLYKGLLSAKPDPQERKRCDEECFRAVKEELKVCVASLGLFLQYVVSVLCSVVMDRWVVLLGARMVYVSSLALLALATAVMSVSEVLTVTIMAGMTGYTFCVLQILPYTLLCLYHSDRQPVPMTMASKEESLSLGHRLPQPPAPLLLPCYWSVMDLKETPHQPPQEGFALTWLYWIVPASSHSGVIYNHADHYTNKPHGRRGLSAEDYGR
ncbi:LOW QUALITY PROTEIN: solute carrier family 45 member 3 [Polymixia lowei]